MQEVRFPSPNQWFYEEKGQRLGGIEEAAMVALIKSGKLGRGSIVWQEGFNDWMKLEDTDLQTHLDTSSPPPLSGKAVRNSLIWVLAFAPLIGLFLEVFVAMLVYDNERRATNAVADGKFFYISLALNILLSVMDMKRLQKAGYDTRAFGRWVWVIPVYLFQRAKHLKHNFAYFAVWIVCFLLVLLSSAA